MDREVCGDESAESELREFWIVAGGLRLGITDACHLKLVQDIRPHCESYGGGWSAELVADVEELGEGSACGRGVPLSNIRFDHSIQRESFPDSLSCASNMLMKLSVYYENSCKN